MKWNLFRFGSRTWITYLLNQHAPFFAVKDSPLVPPQQSNSLFVFALQWNKNRPYIWDFSSLPLPPSLSLFASLSCLTADKINNLTGAGLAACWITLCFCCDFEAWREIKERLIWSRQEYFTVLNTVSIRLGGCGINCFFLHRVNFS